MAQTIIDLNLLNGTNSFVVEGASLGDNLGFAVSIFSDTAERRANSDDFLLASSLLLLGHSLALQRNH